jgi:hypothetical protein
VAGFHFSFTGFFPCTPALAASAVTAAVAFKFQHPSAVTGRTVAEIDLLYASGMNPRPFAKSTIRVKRALLVFYVRAFFLKILL